MPKKLKQKIKFQNDFQNLKNFFRQKNLTNIINNFFVKRRFCKVFWNEILGGIEIYMKTSFRFGRV